LQSRGTVYSVDTDLYFRSNSDPDFGNRSHLLRTDQLRIFAERGGDPDRIGKEDPLDCLVWMSRRPDEPGWESELGEGRPGWHIECSAIALSYLDPDPNSEFSIDIQGGGSDLLFPHHDMGAAQGQIIASKPFARTYVHTGMIGLDGEKMSKSKGNLVFVSKLIQQGHSPMAIRLALMAHPFGSDHMWTSDDLMRAEILLEKIHLALSRTEVAPTASVIQEVVKALSENLNTAKVLALLEKWAEDSIEGVPGGSAGEISRALDLLIGLAI
jgi:L-cysteine:1D-myo-inositol 2-amino-2-deoxy-alpha-D-glucopyranoside ligase